MDLDKITNISNNFLKRFYSILFLIPIYFYSVISNNYLSTLIIFMTSLILSFEWFKITQKDFEKKKNYFIFFLNFFKPFYFYFNKFLLFNIHNFNFFIFNFIKNFF